MPGRPHQRRKQRAQLESVRRTLEAQAEVTRQKAAVSAFATTREALPISRPPRPEGVVRRNDLWALTGRGRTAPEFLTPWQTLRTAGGELGQLAGTGIRGVGRGIGSGVGWGARWAGRGIYGTGAALFQPMLGLGAGAFVGRAVTGSGLGAAMGAGIGLGIGLGFGPAMARGAWGATKGLWGMRQSAAAWGGVGAVAGGMMFGPAGVIPGAVLGSAGGRAVLKSGAGAFGRLAGAMGRRPGVAGMLIGAALAIPTIAQTTHDLFSPTVKPPDFAFARPNAQYGMDPDNLNTQGLTLALHYRR